jgi:hypothetical protein
MFAVNPDFIEYLEFQAVCFDGGSFIKYNSPSYTHLARGNQFGAPLAGTKALRLHNSV